MKISKQERQVAKDLFRACQVEGVLEEARVRQAVQLVVRDKPRGWVAIMSQFERLVRLEMDRRTARIESPTPLSSEQQSDVKARLEKIYGPQLQYQFTENPELLGGLRIRVGSDVYDGTVETRLAVLQESFG